MTYRAKRKTSLGTKIFVWAMFIAMSLSFAAPILYYLTRAN